MRQPTPSFFPFPCRSEDDTLCSLLPRSSPCTNEQNDDDDDDEEHVNDYFAVAAVKAEASCCDRAAAICWRCAAVGT